MKVRCVLFVAAIVSATGAIAAPASAVELVRIDQVPEQVRATIWNWEHDAQVGVIIREAKPGSPTLYRVRLTYAGQPYTLLIAEDGKLVAVLESH